MLEKKDAQQPNFFLRAKKCSNLARICIRLDLKNVKSNCRTISVILNPTGTTLYATSVTKGSKPLTLSFSAQHVLAKRMIEVRDQSYKS